MLITIPRTSESMGASSRKWSINQNFSFWPEKKQRLPLCWPYRLDVSSGAVSGTSHYVRNIAPPPFDQRPPTYLHAGVVEPEPSVLLETGPPFRQGLSSRLQSLHFNEWSSFRVNVKTVAAPTEFRPSNNGSPLENVKVFLIDRISRRDRSSHII